MILTYGIQDFNVTSESVYHDFIIPAETLEEACDMARLFQRMTEYTFDLKNYKNMTVTRIIIRSYPDIAVKVMLREKTELETVRDELQELRSDIETFANSASKSDAAKLLDILNKRKEAK